MTKMFETRVAGSNTPSANRWRIFHRGKFAASPHFSENKF
jgi:hypothetical protein